MGVLDDIKEKYPTLAWLINDPEVGPLLRDAVDPNKGFSPSTFQQKLYETQWFKTRSTHQRQWEILQHTDPGEAKRRFDQHMENARNQFAQHGIKVSSQFLRDLTTIGMNSGVVSESREALNDRMNWLISLGADNKYMTKSGAIPAAIANVKALGASQYYVPVSKKNAYEWGVRMAYGVLDETTIRNDLSRQAISLYPHLRRELETGKSMEDIFSGHRAIIARELELAPDQIDFTKGNWAKVIGITDPKQNAIRPMSLHEAQTLARQDTRWWNTSGGKEQDAGMTNYMLKMFGARA